MTATSRDIGQINKKAQAGIAELLVQAARDSGRGPFALALDYLRLRRWPGRLRFYEYFLYELFDRARWSDAERAQFLSAHIHWPIVNQCNDQTWWAVTEDKWLSSVVLRHTGVPVPENVAVFDPGPRAYPDVPKLRNGADLRGFFGAGPSFPLFAKPMTGMWSAGAIRIAGADAEHVQIDGQDTVTHAQLAETVFGGQPYLIQTCLKPHGFFDGITGATATVRCLNLIGEDGLSVPYTVLKLPMGKNVADNFWRPGNLVCDLDPETGEVRRIVAKQAGRRRELAALPGSGRPLIGERLPFWDALRAVNEKVALLHGVNRYGSTDIALTETGPVVVEVNNGCAFELIQIATGRGLLTEEMAAFFRRCGVDL